MVYPFCGFQFIYRYTYTFTRIPGTHTIIQWETVQIHLEKKKLVFIVHHLSLLNGHSLGILYSLPLPPTFQTHFFFALTPPISQYPLTLRWERKRRFAKTFINWNTDVCRYFRSKYTFSIHALAAQNSTTSMKSHCRFVDAFHESNTHSKSKRHMNRWHTQWPAIIWWIWIFRQMR